MSVRREYNIYTFTNIASSLITKMDLVICKQLASLGIYIYERVKEVTITIKTL